MNLLSSYGREGGTWPTNICFSKEWEYMGEQGRIGNTQTRENSLFESNRKKDPSKDWMVESRTGIV